MRKYIVCLFLCLSSFIGFSQNNTYSIKDKAMLNNLVTNWDRYWNIHNMDSMGTLLKDNVDFINVAGQWLKGKKETVEVHKERHLLVFKNSTFKSDSIDIKYIKDDVAILHILWGIVGDVDPDGTARTPRHGIFTWIALKENGKWLLSSIHNVNIRETGAFMNSPKKQ